MNNIANSPIKQPPPDPSAKRPPVIKLPAEPRPENLIALIDSREQNPLDLSPLRTEPATLTTGDYSLKGLADHIAVERKSLGDLIACIGRERSRFEKEVMRLLAFPCRALIVEASWAQLEMGQWQGRITPKQATASVLRWMERGLPVLLVGNHRAAGEAVSKMLFLFARARWRECRSLVQSTLQAMEGQSS